MTDELEQYDEQSDAELLGESLDREIDEAPPEPLKLTMDDLFGPEMPQYEGDRVDTRTGPNPIDEAAKGTHLSIFDLAHEFNATELRERAEALGAESYEATSFDPAAVLARKIMLSADFAERMAKPAVRPTQEQELAQESELSRDLREMDDSDFEDMITLAQAGGQMAYGGNRVARQMLKRMNAPKTEEE